MRVTRQQVSAACLRRCVDDRVGRRDFVLRQNSATSSAMRISSGTTTHFCM
jgi:hypothetical protein